MNKEDVLGFAKKALPWIGAAATGNVPALVTMAAAAVSSALGTEVPATPNAVAAAIASATPEQLLALKTAEQDFQLKMKEWGYKEATELSAMEFADMADARKRDSEFMKSGRANHRADIMLALTYIGLVSLVACMLLRNIDANSALGGVVILLIGKLINQWETGFQFEFGTSRSSRTKDDTISNLTNK